MKAFVIKWYLTGCRRFPFAGLYNQSQLGMKGFLDLTLVATDRSPMKFRWRPLELWAAHRDIDMERWLLNERWNTGWLKEKVICFDDIAKIIPSVNLASILLIYISKLFKYIIGINKRNRAFHFSLSQTKTEMQYGVTCPVGEKLREGDVVCLLNSHLPQMRKQRKELHLLSWYRFLHLWLNLSFAWSSLHHYATIKLVSLSFDELWTFDELWLSSKDISKLNWFCDRTTMFSACFN